MSELGPKPYSEEEAQKEAQFLTELSFANTNWAENSPEDESPSAKARFLDQKLDQARDLIAKAKESVPSEKAELYKEVQVILKTFKSLGLYVWETRHTWETANWSVFPEEKTKMQTAPEIIKPEGIRRIEGLAGIVSGIKATDQLKQYKGWIGVGLFESYPNDMVANTAIWGQEVFGDFETVIVDEARPFNDWAVFLTQRYEKLNDFSVIKEIIDYSESLYKEALLAGSDKSQTVKNLVQIKSKNAYVSTASQELQRDREHFNQFFMKLWQILTGNEKTASIVREISRPFVKNKKELIESLKKSANAVTAYLGEEVGDLSELHQKAEEIVWNYIGSYTVYEIALIFYFALRKDHNVKVGPEWEKPYDKFAIALATEPEYEEFQKMTSEYFDVSREHLSNLGFLYLNANDFRKT